HISIQQRALAPCNPKLYRYNVKRRYPSLSNTGVYKCCFSNEFSTFSHKTVYFDFQGGNDPPIVPEMLNRITALTLKESSCVTIHEALKTISDSQTHYRLRETIILCVVSISQVVMLRSFFTDKNASLGVST
uniref:Transmembrane p24 trafficking protein 3 n=1 Tax=Erpetoichthys calabaricus TaxID=27687 RepID=A0A8C4XB89_ERPCA